MKKKKNRWAEEGEKSRRYVFNLEKRGGQEKLFIELRRQTVLISMKWTQ